MCMSKRQYENRALKYKSLENEIKALEAELEALKKELIEDMEKEGLIVGEGLTLNVFWTPYDHKSFDSKRFKADYGEDVYQAYVKVTPSHRFRIA